MAAPRCAICGALPGCCDHEQPPPPPTGPQTDIPDPEESRYSRYLEWRRSADGETAVSWITEVALYRFRQLDARRISARTLVGEARLALKIKINDLYSPWMADELVARFPELLAVVERRKRRKTKTT